MPLAILIMVGVLVIILITYLLIIFYIESKTVKSIDYKALPEGHVYVYSYRASFFKREEVTIELLEGQTINQETTEYYNGKININIYIIVNNYSIRSLRLKEAYLVNMYSQQDAF